ncbi:MAG: prolipoprotein diacylglyceryl transferase [Clostridium sp.]|nr:prolipoprotein diacylglyceryl transferase [Clostridium sp.]MCM1208143.1 prolipoprotein diacylglyceryl transferase [Ruminococcus sp.]
MMYDIRFPGLGIVLKNIKDGFSIFGFEIKFYGVIIALGFLFAYILVSKEAKRTGQNDELYLDYVLWLIIPAILGARAYYIIFSWRDYFQAGKGFKNTLIDIINIRNGGLAIYGGVIAGVIVTIIFAKKKKVSFPLMADTISIGLLIGQIMGRWGNFLNREAFGEYTDSILAMQLPVNYFSENSNLNGLVSSGVITQKMAENVVTIDGMHWISVHPTFLYESLWNLALLVIIMLYRKYKKFDGELFLMYLWGYGLGRVWIEGLRTDSLMISGLNIRVSQLLAAICVLAASIILVKKRMDYAKVVADKSKVEVDE